VNPRELGKEVLGVVLAGTSVFLLASLLSFDVGDVPALVSPARAEPVNLGGQVGVGLASSLLKWVGNLGAMGTALVILAFAASCLRRQPASDQPVPTEVLDGVQPPAPVDPLRRIVGGLVCVLTLALVERVIADAGWGSLFSRGYPAGGYWGVFLSAEATRLLGGAGTSIAMSVVLFVGVILSTDRPVRDLLGRSVSGAKQAAAKAAEGVAAAEEALAASATDEAEATEPSGKATRKSGPKARAELTDVTAEADDDGTEAEAEAKSGSDTRTRSGSAARRRALKLPSAKLLSPTPTPTKRLSGGRDDRGKTIEETLAQFKVQATVVSVETGPAVTQFALELGKGIKVQRVSGLLDNLALALRVPGIRLQAPIPGTGWVGLEVPNDHSEVVRLRELIEHPAWKKKEPALPVFLGKDSVGRPLIADLAKMPHLLIAGATGSGKSVCINSIIVSLLMTRTPNECQMILIDPKQVEMTAYKNVPHLLAPVVTDMRQAGAVLDWAVKKMEQRYSYLAAAGVRQIKEYNALTKEEIASRQDMTVEQLEKKKIPWKLPYVVLVVDELNDLMMIAQKEVEASIMRLAQKSRAVGIHVVLATQRPSVDVITGVIKSNLPSRIAFRVSSKVDSRTILDCIGADKLLGMGDMLFLPPGRSQPMRALGALVTDKEVNSVVKALTKQATPNYSEDLVSYAKEAGERARSGSGRAKRKSKINDKDPVYLDAIRVVLTEEKGSVSLVQRKLEIGYGRSARYLDMMCEQGIVGPARGAKPREVKMTLDDWERRRREAA
jgi:S-DNA-T family DNA segregation ATPase FtsK/SpoIIIE